MSRALWKGAITFGLVHMPVALNPATRESSIDFQWLDRKSLDPVGYKRYNKRTGRELKAQDIVKGVRQPNGKYVVLSDEEIKAAFPKSTQTIEIEAFIKIEQVPLMMLERPYYIQPARKSEKVYVLLREAMREAGVAALARIVMHTKEHFAAILVVQNALVLDILRWSADLRPIGSLELPAKADATIKPQERKMASELIQQMTADWKAGSYAEHFSTAIGNLIKRKVAAGESKTVEPLEEAAPKRAASNVIDLAELLAKSMRARHGAPPAQPDTQRNATQSRVRRRRSAAR